jgi:type VI secretion system secreted protein VgrG
MDHDLNGEDQTTASGNSQLEQLNQQLSDYQALQAKFFIAHSTVRDAVGYRFELMNTPKSISNMQATKNS